MAGPKPGIEPDQVAALARLGASVVDIAGFFGCPEATVQRFAAEIDRGHAERRIALLRRQWQAAESGDVAMLIWLGKQVLGQSEKVETKSQVGPLVDREAQWAMLSSEKALQLACDLDEEIIRVRKLNGLAPGRNGSPKP